MNIWETRQWEKFSFKQKLVLILKQFDDPKNVARIAMQTALSEELGDLEPPPTKKRLKRRP